MSMGRNECRLNRKPSPPFPKITGGNDLWLQSRFSDLQESQILHLTSCRNMKTYTVAPNLEISFRDSGEEACAPTHVAVMDI